MKASSTGQILPSTAPQHTRLDFPDFPSYAYAASQNQFQIPPYIQSARSHSSHPAPSTSCAVATSSLNRRETGQRYGSRTAGNSPAESPGLFSPAVPSWQVMDDGEVGLSYASPYLHRTHRQMPKETHTADVDVDPISGRKIINQYEILDELGRGVHGKVKLGRNLETDEHVAIKIVDRLSRKRKLGKSDKPVDKIKREIAILKKARHPNIVGLLEVIDDPAKKKIYIILEHVEMGEVKWRTEGDDAIVIVQYRRSLRESMGIFEEDRKSVV